MSWRPPEIAGTIGRPAGRTAVTAERVPIFYSVSPSVPAFTDLSSVTATAFQPLPSLPRDTHNTTHISTYVPSIHLYTYIIAHLSSVLVTIQPPRRIDLCVLEKSNVKVLRAGS